MEIVPLAIEGTWMITPKQHGDARGLFLEVFKDSMFQQAVGHPFSLAQMNCSVSARGTVRGIHFADLPPGQAKYVTCLSGRIRDVIVDVRVGSPTFGQTLSLELDDLDRRAVYLSEGLGHGFSALAPSSTVAYLCSTEYSLGREHEVHPLDPVLAIDWGLPADEISLSAKDAAAPSLDQAFDAGHLPQFDVCRTFRSGLSAAQPSG